MGCHFLLREIFLTQGSKLHLLFPLIEAFKYIKKKNPVSKAAAFPLTSFSLVFEILSFLDS